jgi:4-alpha-glucanotransferase
MFLDRRRAGLALHPTSLPGPHGSGDLGPWAHHLVDRMADSGLTVWQLLPLNPPGPGESPYQSLASFALSPWLVALEPLVEAGWLPAVHPPPNVDPARCHWPEVLPWRLRQLHRAHAGFAASASAAQREAFAAWQQAQAHWLDDVCLFLAIDAQRPGEGWWQWPQELRQRDASALLAARKALAADIERHAFIQWCAAEQWAAVRRHAASRGVLILGDLPLYVAHHSADVWADPAVFDLSETGSLRAVAGAPPDGYNPLGQHWGNPLYRWPHQQATGFDWWIRRVRRSLELADGVRIDHFRGLAAYWSIPAGAPTAQSGDWVPAPGQALFDALTAALGPLPVVAEDLGVLTPEVFALRDRHGFPGMAVVQEAFNGDARHAFLPHNIGVQMAAYSSTHDSDTVQGWWRQAPAGPKAYARSYLQTRDSEVHRAILRATWQSVARLAVGTVQDLLGLGSEHRMNRPGEASGQWAWRCTDAMLSDTEAWAWLAELTAQSGRDVRLSGTTEPEN